MIGVEQGEILKFWDELDTESADIKGEISTKMKKDLAMMVEPLSIDVEDDGEQRSEVLNRLSK